MSEVAIDVRELRKQFSLDLRDVRSRKRTALDGMTLKVERGEIYGFLGPNGAGKTTTIKILTSLLRSDSGTAAIFGSAPWEEAARRRIGYLPESPIFYDHLTGREFLRFCGKLCGLGGQDLNRRADTMLERVGLKNAADMQIRRYSKGMTQRVGIAQAILHDPDLVILDEPMSGLDPMGRADVRDIIIDLKRAGKTIFFSTHIIPDVEAICSRIGIVNHGRMVREGTVAELLNESVSGATEVLAQSLPDAFSVPDVEESVAVGGRRMFVAPSAPALDTLLNGILQVKGTVVSVTPRRSSLEELVVKLLATKENAQ
ncbi:MAG: ABC transporter ATP-binding protein [Myxococcales bacterium]